MLKLLKSDLIAEISELSLFDSNQLVNLLSTGPEITQVWALWVKSSVQALGLEELLAADETGEELEPSHVAHIQLVPHVKDIVYHPVVAKILITEYSFNLLEQVWSISIE